MVYVDDMHLTPMGRLGRMRMCHMVADTSLELLEMADRIGVDRKWIQHAGTPKEHFDIATSKRALAVAAGAVELTMSGLARVVRAKRRSPTSIAAEHNGKPVV